MNTVKIGKFIANCRKEKKITQEELAEKLYITDRAVSKWERGLSLPDADKMIDLCNILDINVNELLIGEKIDMKDNDKKTEELLIELARKEEESSKRILTSMWVILIVTAIFYIALLTISCSLIEKGPVLGAIICISTIIVVITCFYALKLEVEAGYYECAKCHHKFKPTYKEALFASHMSTTRHLRCPKCNKKSWAKKVISKD